MTLQHLLTVSFFYSIFCSYLCHTSILEQNLIVKPMFRHSFRGRRHSLRRRLLGRHRARRAYYHVSRGGIRL